MKYTAKQYAEALMDSLSDVSPKDTDRVLDNFVQVLVENNDIRQFEHIAAEYHKLELAKKGIKQVEITSAHALNKDSEQAIIHELNKIVKGNLELKKKVDENLIGGVVVRFDDKMIDSSVKSNLEQLKKDLTN